MNLSPTEAQLILFLNTPRDKEWRLFESEATEKITEYCQTEVPGVWAESNPPGLASKRAPVIIELKAGAHPQQLRQYPISREAQIGIQTHLEQLKDVGILVECQSPWNTPLLPVKKPNGDYRPVQDLCSLNQLTVSASSSSQSLHPSQVPPEAAWFTCLDLKDTFFCIELAPISQPIFAFEWTDPNSGRQMQLTWTRLPQGFKNSPTLFSEALASDLASFPREQVNCTLLQYVDDLFIACLTRKACHQATIAL